MARVPGAVGAARNALGVGKHIVTQLAIQTERNVDIVGHR